MEQLGRVVGDELGVGGAGDDPEAGERARLLGDRGGHDRRELALAQDRGEQVMRLTGALLRPERVRLLVEDRVDLVRRDDALTRSLLIKVKAKRTVFIPPARRNERMRLSVAASCGVS